MHCLMSSEEWHRKIPFTGYLLAISISVPVVDLESVRGAEYRLSRRLGIA